MQVITKVALLTGLFSFTSFLVNAYPAYASWWDDAVESVETIGDAVSEEVNSCLSGGCDPTTHTEEINQAIDHVAEEVNSCFGGGCDPTTHTEEIDNLLSEAETIGQQIENFDWREVAEVYNNPSSLYRNLWSEMAELTDEALGGVINRNFGHVTNKWELRRELESRGIVAYGLEISHDEYMRATTYTAASVASENPGPLVYYFEDLATRSYSEMLLGLEEALERLPDYYGQRYQRLLEVFTPEYIATALATYVSTGEVPDIALEIGMPEVKFGILTYSRGERTPLGVVTTPNTHQPYLLIVPPELGISVAEVEQTINSYTIPQEEIAIPYEAENQPETASANSYDNFYSSLAVTAGFSPDPLYFDTSMGAVSGGSQQTTCEGWTVYLDEPNLPDHVLYFDTPTSIEIFAETNTPSADTALVIVDNNGNVYCSDDVYGANPSIAGTWDAGTVLGIWVGDVRTDASVFNVPYTLAVTER